MLLEDVDALDTNAGDRSWVKTVSTQCHSCPAQDQASARLLLALAEQWSGRGQWILEVTERAEQRVKLRMFSCRMLIPGLKFPDLAIQCSNR